MAEWPEIYAARRKADQEVLGIGYTEAIRGDLFPESRGYEHETYVPAERLAEVELERDRLRGFLIANEVCPRCGSAECERERLDHLRELEATDE